MSIEDKRELFAEALNARNALALCSRCGNNKFTMGKDYLNQKVCKDLNLENPTSDVYMGPPSTLPTIIVICDNCGYLMQHAIGVLKPEMLNEESA